ncbi:MAG TPA: RidA family protein [Pseudonocardiaceae bacterium]|jgi:enamine deaminase RidA (YjgF/YER057c/UK114 family)|nr:RidA family protein [Pseudonocardiaceae bacterium]
MAPRKVIEVADGGFPDWYPSSSAVVAGPFAFTASLGATDWATGQPAASAAVNPGMPHSSGHPVKLQVREAYRRLTSVLDAAGTTLENSVSANQWQPTYHGRAEARAPIDADPYPLHWEAWRRVAHAYIQGRDEFLLADRPASCLMPVDRLIQRDSDIEIQLVSLLADSGITKRAYAHDVHSPLGGYSVGVEAGPWVFSAGFIATDFQTGLHPNARVPEHIWYGNQVAGEVAETLRQIRVTMEAAGARWADLAKVVMYLTPEGIRNMAAVEEVWQQQWPVDPPARAIIPVSGIGGVKHGNVEIYVIATRPTEGGDREVIHTDRALAPLGHSVQAVRSGPLLFLSTQLGRAEAGPSAGTVAARAGLPFSGRHIVDQVHRMHEDIAAICDAAGTSIQNTVKVDAFLSDFADLTAFFDCWGEPFTAGKPASGFFEVPAGAQLLPGCDLTVDLIVAMP